jgi:hypothetical protein
MFANPMSVIPACFKRWFDMAPQAGLDLDPRLKHSGVTTQGKYLVSTYDTIRRIAVMLVKSGIRKGVCHTPLQKS